MITWPLDVDQPGTSAYLTLMLDVAFELVEVRTGLGLRPLHRGVRPTGTDEAVAAEMCPLLEHLVCGDEGQRKRRNAQGWRDKLDGNWHKGGAGV